MSTLLTSASSRPLLNPCVVATLNESALELGTPALEMVFSDESAQLLVSALPLLHGGSTVSEIASATGFSSNQILAHLRELETEGLIFDSSAPSEPILVAEFLPRFEAACGFWSKAVIEQPFWQMVLEGRASDGQILGLGIETYHFVESANVHMANAVAHCRVNIHTRELFGRRYVEEHDHSEIFLDGLAGAALEKQRVQQSPPLASTLALADYLNELAIADSLAYAATFGVMQANRKDANARNIDKFYSFLSNLYPDSVSIFDSFRRHALIDVELEHQELAVEHMLSEQDVVTPDQIQRIYNALRSVSEFFILLFEEIGSYYGSSQADIPRRLISMANAA